MHRLVVVPDKRDLATRRGPVHWLGHATPFGRGINKLRDEFLLI